MVNIFLKKELIFIQAIIFLTLGASGWFGYIANHSSIVL